MRSRCRRSASAPALDVMDRCLCCTTCWDSTIASHPNSSSATRRLPTTCGPPCVISARTCAPAAIPMTTIASSMRIIDRTAALRSALAEPRRRGQGVALVPTMGYLHEGHLHLAEEARRHAAVVVMSVFVNPMQFGPHEDYTRYPRDLEGDRTVVVTPLSLADRWEGAARPGHFTGVLTIVTKLFNIVQPTVAVFGQKDI